jgi:hypothetical protein
MAMKVMLYDKNAGQAAVVGFDINGAKNLDHNHTGWSKSWDIIVPGFFVGQGQQILLYDREAGQAAVVGFDINGAKNLDHINTGWSKSWDIIVPGNFVGKALRPQSQILLYDREAGQAAVVGFDANGAKNLDHINTGWSKSWDIIVPGNFLENGLSQILLYDRKAGHAAVVGFDANGAKNLDHINTGWSKSWDVIVVGHFVATTLAQSQILLYDREAGQAAVVGFDHNGVTNLDHNNTGWSKGWTTLVTISASFA